MPWQNHFAMRRIDFIHQPRANSIPARSLRAFFASCVFHGLLLGSLVGLSFIYRSHLLPIRSGSAPGAFSISIEKMVVVSSPPQPVPKPPAIAQMPQLREPETPPQPARPALPILAAQPSKPAQILQPTASKPASTTHLTITPTSPATTPSSPPQAAVAASFSSYAPGPSVLPHPPYPAEARDRGQTGTVVMNVLFDGKGNVAQADVAQTSGVALLDSTTRSYIRRHWHSAAYAGQTVSVPVQYKLEYL